MPFVVGVQRGLGLVFSSQGLNTGQCDRCLTYIEFARHDVSKEAVPKIAEVGHEAPRTLLRPCDPLSCGC